MSYDSAKLKKEVVSDCQDDFVSLGHILWYLRQWGVGATWQERRDIVLELLRELLSANAVVIGTFEPKGAKSARYTIWASPVGESLERTLREWNEYARDLEMGEVAWITAAALRDRFESKTKA